MDYNWLENTPQVSQGWRGALPIWQPDYSFLQSMDMRINQQFDQGVSKIANAYSLFNQPVLGDKARSVQQSYARQAQDRLKDLSSADLSDPKNVEIAENIMSPFYTDQNLLTNISYAKYYNSQDDKLDAWQNSTDPLMRAQYNDEMRSALQYKRQEYASAPYDKSAYNKIERISATPYFDINAEVDKAYKDEQNKGVDNVSIIGSRMTTEHNGVKSLDAFRNYYLSRIGDKYNGQLKVHAYVTAQRYKQEILSHNPGLSSNEVDQRFAQENVDALSNSYKTNRDSYNKIGDYWDGRAQDILKNTKNGKTAGQEQLEKVKFYQEQAQAHRDEANKYDAKYQEMGGGDANSDKYQKFFKELYEHPEQYIGDIDKQIRADNWAKGMAYMNTSTKVELDPVTEAYIKHREKNAELQIQQNQVNATLRGQTLGWMKETGTDLKGNRLPGFRPDLGGWSTDLSKLAGKSTADNGGVNPDGTPNGNAWRPMGLNITELAHLPVDVVRKQQDATAAGINKDIFDPNSGLAIAFTANNVLKPSELLDLENYSTKLMTGQQPSAAEVSIFERVKKEMQDKGIDISKLNNSHGFQEAIISYASSSASDLRKQSIGDNLYEKHKIGTTMAMTAAQLQQRMTLYNQNQESYTKKETQVLNDPLFERVRVKDADGKYRMVQPGDLAGSLPKQVVLREVGSENTVTLTGKDLADAYLSNKIDFQGGMTRYKGGADINYNGKSYTINKIDGRNYTLGLRRTEHTLANPNLANWGEFEEPSSYEKEQVSHVAKRTFLKYFDPIIDKFGNSEGISKLKNLAGNKVLEGLTVLKNGMITQRVGADPNDDKTENLALGSAKELSSPSVARVIYNEDGTTVASDDEQKNLRQALEGTTDTKHYIALVVPTTTPSGDPAVEVTMQNKGTEETKSKDAKFTQSKYILPISSLENTQFLKSLPWKTTFMFDDMYDPSKTITAPPIVKNSGQNFTIRGVDPGPDGKATAVYVYLSSSLPASNGSGQSEESPERAYKIPTVGPNAKNSEEIMNFVYGRVTSELMKGDNIILSNQQKFASHAEGEAQADAQAKKYEIPVNNKYQTVK